VGALGGPAGMSVVGGLTSAKGPTTVLGMDTAVGSGNDQVTTPNGIARGDVVIYNDGLGEKPYTVTAVEPGGLRIRLTDSLGRPFPFAVGCYDCRPASPAPAPAPVAVARPRARRPHTTACTRSQSVTKPALPSVVKEYRTTVFRNGRTQQQCWSATTVDGAWRIERQDDVNTVWVITHIATGHEVPQWFGTLDRARAAIGDGYAASTLPAAQPANA
jgi:hypothetical protein